MGFINKLFGSKTLEEKEREYIAFIRELLARPEPPVKDPKTPDEFAKNIAAEFLVDSLVVARRNGSVLMSTEGNSFKRAVKNSGVYELISSEFPMTKMLSIKDNDSYNTIYPQGDLIYMFRSSADISLSETKCMVKKLNSGLDLRAMNNLLNAKVINPQSDINGKGVEEETKIRTRE